MELKLKGEKGIARFEDLILNEANKLEFKKSSIVDDFSITFVLNEEKALQMTGVEAKVRIPIPEDNFKNLMSWKKDVLKKLNFYKNVVAGDESIICYPLDLVEFPYLITTQSIMDNREISPKFTMGLLYIFSDKFIKTRGIEKPLEITNYESLQQKLGKALRKKYQGHDVLNIKYTEMLDLLLKED